MLLRPTAFSDGLKGRLKPLEIEKIQFEDDGYTHTLKYFYL